MTQQERLKKLFEENAIEVDYGGYIQAMTEDTFIRVASELLEEREQKTDIERCLDFYRSIGIECKVNICKEDGQGLHLTKGDQYITLTDAHVGIGDEETTDPRFNGYGMYTSINFDKDGNFKSQGFWE